MWEVVYIDEIASVHIKENKVTFQNENEFIGMKVFPNELEATIEATMAAALFKMRKSFE